MTREVQEKTIKYIADEGKLLSNSMVAEGSESNRMFFKVAYVPLNSSAVFVEFTQDEVDAWKAKYPSREKMH